MSDASPPAIRKDEHGRWVIELEPGIGLAFWKEANRGWCVSMLSNHDINTNVQVGDQTLGIH